MSTKYKFIDQTATYFTTSTIVGWTDVFTREIYKTILLDSIKFCQLNKGLKIHAWVLMTNHLHTICSCKEGADLGSIWRDCKSFTAMTLINAIINNPKESRRSQLLNIFEEAAIKGKTKTRFKFWEYENHPILLDSTEMYNQRLNYLHNNPVTAGYVSEPAHWVYSSAGDYYLNNKGLLDIIVLDGF